MINYLVKETTTMMKNYLTIPVLMKKNWGSGGLVWLVCKGSNS